MATTSAAEYQAALDRARKDGVQVVSIVGGVATVYSSKSIQAYQVHIFPAHMVCDCESRKYCKHRAIVRERLITERVTAEAEVARLRGATRGPLVDDRKPISIWK